MRPTIPQYGRPTPVECVPFFRNPVRPPADRPSGRSHRPGRASRAMSGDQAAPPAGAGSRRGWLRLGPRPVAALAGRRAEEPLDVSHGPPVRLPHGEHRLQPLRDVPQVIGPSGQGTPTTREQGGWGAKTLTTHPLVVTEIGWQFLPHFPAWLAAGLLLPTKHNAFAELNHHERKPSQHPAVAG